MSHKTKGKDKSKYTLFNNKTPLWECNNYLTDGPSACAFAMCHQHMTNRIMIEESNDVNGRQSSRRE